MGSGGSTSSQNLQGLGTLSLGPIGAAQLFGVPTGVNRKGGLTLTGNAQILPQVFDPSQFQSLGQLAQPFPSFLDQGTASTLGQQSSDLLTGVLPGIQELATTGFADPIQELTSFLFGTEIAPQIEEQLGASLGLDTGDSDLRAALVREGQRASLEAANSAVQNRILGLQLAQGAPSAVAGQLGATEQALQQGVRQGSPEGQLLDLLLTLGGVDTQAGGVGRSSSQGKNVGVLS